MSSAANSREPDALAGTRAWRSLGARLALWYVAVTLVSFIAVALVFAFRMHAWVESEGEQTTQTVIEHYRSVIETGGAQALQATLASDGGARRSVALRVTDEDNVELLRLSSDELSRDVAATLGQSRQSSAGAASRDWHVAVTRLSAGRSLTLALHDGAASGVLQRTREIAWLILASGIVAAVLGAFVIARRSLRPLADLSRATHDIIASGDLSLRVPTRGTDDDLDELASLFNGMLARNEALVRAMKESLDNVAHDLRTPLTRLRAGAEVALTGPADPERHRDALADVIEESDRVLGMLTTLTDITGAETGAMHLDTRPEDLSAIAREAIELYDLVAGERGVHVTTHLSLGVDVLVDRRRILQVCANLLDNAIKYTQPGGRIVIDVRRSPPWGALSISDTGLGIASADLPRIWDRLFRADHSRTESGLGLGLALVKAIVLAHGGTVDVSSSIGTGSIFVIKLPLARP